MTVPTSPARSMPIRDSGKRRPDNPVQSRTPQTPRPMRRLVALVVLPLLALSCRSTPVVVPPAERGAPAPAPSVRAPNPAPAAAPVSAKPLPSTPPDTVLPFTLVEPSTFAYPQQRLSGFVEVRDTVIYVLVTGGVLSPRTAQWELLDLRAELAVGDPSSGRWSTPISSDSIPVDSLHLAPNGSIADTLRFRLRGATARHLETHWLTFEMHAIMTHPKVGRAEVVEWFAEQREPLFRRRR